MNDFICDRLKSTSTLQESIELNKLDYRSKARKKYNFSKTSLSIVFLRDTHKNVSSIENIDNEQSNLFQELSKISKGEKPIEKITFLKNISFT